MGWKEYGLEQAHCDQLLDANHSQVRGTLAEGVCVFSKGEKGATRVSLRNGDPERVPGIIAGLPDDEAAEEPESDGDPVEAAAISLKPAVDEMTKRGELEDKLKGIPPLLSAAVAGPVHEDELIGKPAPSTTRVGQDIPTTPGMEPLPGIKSSGSGASAPASASPTKRDEEIGLDEISKRPRLEPKKKARFEKAEEDSTSSGCRNEICSDAR